jgi:hypothetical protein
MLANNNKKNRVAYGAASPVYPISYNAIEQQLSRRFGDRETIDNLAEGSVVDITQKQIFKRKCWIIYRITRI